MATLPDMLAMRLYYILASINETRIFFNGACLADHQLQNGVGAAMIPLGITNAMAPEKLGFPNWQAHWQQRLHWIPKSATLYTTRSMWYELPPNSHLGISSVGSTRIQAIWHH